MGHHQQGFTFIEIMIVVAIIAILAAIAWPNYQNYRVKTNRTAVQGDMLEIAKKMSLYKVSNGTYANATIAKMNNGKTVLSAGGQDLYNVAFTPATTVATGWTLVAQPIATTLQKNNGWLCLNDRGQKSWQKGINNCSGLSATSNW